MGERSLQEAFSACGEDLREERAFAEYYVARENGAALELAERMLMDRRPVKALLTGQRGAGKTVELMRLSRDVGSSLLPLFVSLELPPDRAMVPELLVATAQGMCQKAARAGVPVSDKVAKGLTSWVRDTLKVPAEDRSGPAGAAEALGKAAERLRRRELRPELAAAIEARREELGQGLSELASDIRSKGGKEPMLVLDGLDRAGRDQAVAFLLESGLQELQFKCICTLPFAAIHSPIFRALRQSFDSIAVQTLSEMTPGLLATGSGGVLDMRDLVDKRTGTGLMEPAALDMLLLNSGGNPGDLLRYTGSCCLKASMSGRARIDVRTVEGVLDDHRLEMRRFLTAAEWGRLQALHRGKGEEEDELLASLLESGAVLEYPARKPMYHVHPALVPMLKGRESTA